jgi:hypothetical protein
MAVIRQGGRNPNAGRVTTTMGLKDRRGQRCQVCGDFSDKNMTVNANGQFVCENCMRPSDRLLVTGCDPDTCACGGDDASEE